MSVRKLQRGLRREMSHKKLNKNVTWRMYIGGVESVYNKKE